MRRTIIQLTCFTLVMTAGARASAEDVWTEPAPGVRQLVRTAAGPLRYVAVTVDLSRPEHYIRVTRPENRGQTTSGWAGQVGAVVAINGDFFDYDGYQPVGLAVGDDQHWPGTSDQGWSFMACTLEKRCTFDDHTTNTERHPLWREVVGGNGWRLLIDGNIPQYPNEAYYRSDRHPRSGVGLSQDGTTMIFAVAEGRRGDSIGVTYPEFAQFFKDLGAHQALMLDGGGSSAIVVNGARQNRLPSGQSSERVVANHLGILRGSPSAECADVPNGRYCEGSVIHTCQGGEYRGNGDCAAFGASCEVTSDGVGVCVHPDCTGGANGHYCESDSIIRTCEYGQPAGSGDCSAYGSTCETGPEDAYCNHFMCTEGGNATWCDGDTLKSCVDGQPQEDVDCAASEQVCVDGSCVEPDDAEDPVDPDDSSDSMEDSDGSGSDDGEADTSDGETGETAGESDQEPRGDDVEGRGGCSTAPPGGTGAIWIVILATFALFRRLRDDAG